MGFLGALSGLGQEASNITAGQELAQQNALLRQQMLEASMRTALEQRRLGLEEQRLKMQQQPQFLGSYDMPGVGRVGIIQDPTGRISTQTLTAQQPLSELSDEKIAAVAKALPAGEDQAAFTQAVTGYRDLGQPEKALALIGSVGKARPQHILHGFSPDRNSSTGVSMVAWDATTGQLISSVPNIIDNGLLPRVSMNTDAAGVTTVTQIQPQIPGLGAAAPRAGTAAPAQPPAGIVQGRQPSRLAQPPTGIARGGGPPAALAAPPAGLAAPSRTGAAGDMAPETPAQYGLDPNWQIPQGAPGAENDNLRAGANFLLAGGDVTKFPGEARDKLAAQSLAARYGWSQGKFTPKEMNMLKESVKILNDFQNSPALSVLDDDSSRNKLAQFINIDPHKSGRLGTMFNTWMSGQTTPEEREFFRLYMQAVGRISGLAQLTRTGRPTEATIQRLMSELPNPASPNGASSTDGKAAIDYLMDEVRTALQRGGGPDSWLPSGIPRGTVQRVPPPTGSSSPDEIDQWFEQRKKQQQGTPR